MHIIKSVTIVTIIVCMQQIVASDKLYSAKYDNLDVDKILENERVLLSYIKCVLGEGPCTSEGKELKKLLPDALSTGCAKCTEKQKETSEHVIIYLSEKRPDDWARLKAKYDPNDEYEKQFKERAAEREAAAKSTTASGNGV